MLMKNSAEEKLHFECTKIKLNYNIQRMAKNSITNIDIISAIVRLKKLLTILILFSFPIIM